MNIILKQVKNNPKISCPEHIKDMTTFKLTESPEEMIDFIEWIASCWNKSSPSNKKNYSPEKNSNNVKSKDTVRHKYENILN